MLLNRKALYGALVPALASLIVAYVTLKPKWQHARSECVRPLGLGNFTDTVGRLPPVEDGHFRFAVLGDPEEGLTIFHDLMAKARDLGVAFVLITGDVADRPTEAAFENFVHTYASIGEEAPATFAAAGNHDLEPTGLFEKYLGPRQFSFVYGDCLFIFADNNTPASRPSCARYIKDQIERHCDEMLRTYIVVHIPITDFERVGHGVRNYREKSSYLYEILDSEHVDAVLAGHFHGYAREVYGNTLLLTTGGGGGKLHSPEAYYHMVVIDVGPEGFSDTVVRLGDSPPAVGN